MPKEILRPFLNRVVVLGANGFIGTRLLDQLSDHYETLGFDLPKVDISDPASLNAVKSKVESFSETGRLAIINAAGVMDASRSRMDPDLFYRINGLAVESVSEFAAEVSADALVHLSSETVFGTSDEPVAEDAPRIPRHPYGISKLFGELLLERRSADEFARIVLRLPVVVGQKQASENPISQFCKEATTEGKVTLFNGGYHKRKFVFVDDVVSQIAAILAKKPIIGLEFFNVGGFVASMSEISEKVINRMENVSLTHHTNSNQAFSLISASDAIESRFGFRPRTSIDDMITNFLSAGD